MQIKTNVPLKDYSTMRLGGIAEALTTVSTKEELKEALDWAKQHNKPTLMLGGGSNIIFSNGYHGLVIINALHGFEVVSEDDESVVMRIGAGEVWDDIVAQSVARGLSGIERLSAIPGTAGATPVQNVGAYGAEIADVLIELEAYDTKTKTFVTLLSKDCKFSYRNSIFKSPKDRHYIITSITIRLSKQPPEPPFYEALQAYLHKHHVTEYSPAALRGAVVAIRAQKLPDPHILANTGSFFKNPIVQRGKLTQLQQDYPDMPSYEMEDGRIKLLAGWLIDQTGLKGYRSHGMKIYEKNALVFINESAKGYDDLAAFRQEIIDKIHERFGITLEQEPELI
jgi:UDP-N-acetylmuramate dehydrogenase